MPATQIVWFKRDLRLEDHAALSAAAARGPVLPLYIIEPELWEQPSHSTRHWQLIHQSLIDLKRALSATGGELCVRIGAVATVLGALHRELGHFDLLAHEEVGEKWTFDRDKTVLKWCRKRGMNFFQFPQFGVFRGQHDRDGWAKRWREFMSAPAHRLTDNVQWQRAASDRNWQDWRPASKFELPDFQIADPEATLSSFLQHRGEAYHQKMSSPTSAADACSRLSTQLASGRISMRTVVQRTWQAQQAVKSWPAAERGTWPKALSAFQSRLHWHCHFIQKFESEPELEFQNMAPSCNGLREHDLDPRKLRAWQTGHTGYPFIDACMRYLTTTGWINFRMRAMLVSFASYDLWLHWRYSAEHLANLFVDFEPGIHYPQVQMQSGTTGINTLRIYNPVKQSMDQDPEGDFIRRWVPECAGFDNLRIHAPWEATPMEQLAADCEIGKHYPAPIVDHLEAVRFARSRFAKVRGSAAGKADKRSVMQRHGSRKNAHRRAAKTG